VEFSDSLSDGNKPEGKSAVAGSSTKATVVADKKPVIVALDNKPTTSTKSAETSDKSEKKPMPLTKSVEIPEKSDKKPIPPTKSVEIPDKSDKKPMPLTKSVEIPDKSDKKPIPLTKSVGVESEKQEKKAITSPRSRSGDVSDKLDKISTSPTKSVGVELEKQEKKAITSPRSRSGDVTATKSVEVSDKPLDRKSVPAIATKSVEVSDKVSDRKTKTLPQIAEGPDRRTILSKSAEVSDDLDTKTQALPKATEVKDKQRKSIEIKKSNEFTKLVDESKLPPKTEPIKKGSKATADEPAKTLQQDEPGNQSSENPSGVVSVAKTKANPNQRKKRKKKKTSSEEPNVGATQNKADKTKTAS